LERTLGEHIELHTRVGDDLWHAIADPGEIDSVLLNLVTNARDAMPSGGRLLISVTNEVVSDPPAAQPDVQPGDYVCLTVADSGSGMPADVLERAFEPFFTTKEAGGGSGLGLSSVARVARQSGGFVKLASEPEVGTTAALYLPRAARRPPRPVAAAVEHPTGQGEVVLVVEDDDALREMTVDQVVALGYLAVPVRSAREAVELLERGETVDMVLSDVVMPGGMTGFELAEWLRERRPDVPVVLCSGYNDVALPAGAGTPTVLPMLAKPYARRDLAAVLATASRVAGRPGR
jgi:CheY-like chemotaxis protein